MRRSGFTLIELLVVIAIIVVLAAILFPVFARVRGRAQLARCLNNLKQVATAVEMYENDYDGCILPWNIAGTNVWGYYWQDQLNPYIRAMKKGQLGGYLATEQGEIITCPSAPIEQAEGPFWQTAKTYGYNVYLRANLNVAQVRYPAVTLRITECAIFSSDPHAPDAPSTIVYQGGSHFAPVPNPATAGYGFMIYAPGWHDGQQCVLWVDGHVSSISWQKVMERDGAPDPNIWCRLSPKPGSSPD